MRFTIKIDSKIVNMLIVSIVLVIPFAVSYSMNLDNNNPWNNNDNETLNTNNQLRNFSISLNQFSVLDTAGNGGTGNVYIAKKNGGTDDGTMYALKAMKIPTEFIPRVLNIQFKSLNNELEMLKAVRGLQWATKIHYAWHDGKWLFIVMDLGVGGTVQSKLGANGFDVATAKRIAAELVASVECIHNANILHHDLVFRNILIDSNGHLLLTDFGFAERRLDDDSSKRDWSLLSGRFYELFPKPIQDENQLNVIEILRNMTDAQLPELKNHAYFSEVDWEKVAERKSDPPFEPSELQIKENSFNLETLLGMDTDNELETFIVERFCNYSFVAPEHQN